MTQREAAVAGRVTPAMRRVAERERVSLDTILAGVAEGTICIPANPAHVRLDPKGFGKGLSTKVNANIGTSVAFPDTEKEIEKHNLAVRAGADAVMDLSTGSALDIDRTRKAIVDASTVAVGTVPIYQAAVMAQESGGAIIDMTVDGMFDVVRRQAEDGVDFMTIHAGVTLATLSRLKAEGRVMDIVSRGGAFMTGWMLHHELENPFYEQYDRLLEIARKHDVTLSLGDGLRPGCTADATDRAQVQELIILGELVDRAWKAGVQVMVEGPGHVPLNQIDANVKLQKRLCHGAPFYILGPLVTDVAPGYDHITAAIGGALAAAAGADFICYVTPSEHLGLPDSQDVWDGVIAARIAGHAADLVKGVPGATEWDLSMARARKALDWEGQIGLAIDPEKARRLRTERNPENPVECTMCGKYCAMRLVGEYLGANYTRC